MRRLERASGSLATQAVARMDDSLPWFRSMPADQRSWVTLVAQAGIASLVEWCRHPGRPPRLTGEVFGAAPRELVRAVPLKQTVDLIKVTVEVVEDRLTQVVGPGEAEALRLAVLQYSRRSPSRPPTSTPATRRTAVPGTPGSRPSWSMPWSAASAPRSCPAAPPRWAGRPPPRSWCSSGTPPRTSTTCTRPCGAQPGRCAPTCWSGCTPTSWSSSSADCRTWHRSPSGSAPSSARPGGPRPGRGLLAQAVDSAAAALAGLRAAVAWPGAPRPVDADALLAERALDGDPLARAALAERVAAPLDAAGGGVLDTVRAVLGNGGNLEASARALFVHPNTVRYRLKRVTELTGCRPPIRAGPGPCRSRSPSPPWTAAARSGPELWPTPPRRTVLWEPSITAPVFFVDDDGPLGQRDWHGGHVLAVLAPGQGAQKPGMLTDWLELPGAESFFRWAGAIADADLLTLGTTGDAEAIKDTAVTQPLVVAMSLFVARELGGLPGPSRTPRRPVATWSSPATASAS